MGNFLRRVFYNMLAALIVLWLTPGIKVQGLAAFLVVISVFGLWNTGVKHMAVKIFEIPNFRAFYAIAFIVDTIVFNVVIYGVEKFSVKGLLPLFIGIGLMSGAAAVVASLGGDENGTEVLPWV